MPSCSPGTIAGMLLTDIIMGRGNSREAIYDPSRKPAWGMAWEELLVENADVAREIAKHWLGGGDVSPADEVARGEGAISN